MKRTAATAAAAIAAVCMLGSACSKSSSGNASAGATTNATAKSGSSKSDSGGSGGGGGSATCKQLTFAQVQPLLKETITKVAVTALNVNGTGQQCEFDGKDSDSSGQITVQVLRGAAGTQEYTQALSDEEKQIDVAGIGDKASREPESGSVNALSGNEFCSVTYSSSDDIPGVGPLEEAHGATLNIGENNWDVVAQAMGSLCNRIYGSGKTTADLSSLLSAATATPTPSS